MAKRALSLLLALIMALSLCVPAFAAEGDGEAAEAPEVSEAVEDTAPTDDEVAAEPADEAEPAVVDEPAPAVVGVSDAAVAALQKALDAAHKKEAAARNNELHDDGKEGASDFLAKLVEAEAAMAAITAGNVEKNLNTAGVTKLANDLAALAAALSDEPLPSQQKWFFDTYGVNKSVIVKALGLHDRLADEDNVNPGKTGDYSSYPEYPKLQDKDLVGLDVTTDEDWVRAYSTGYLAQLQDTINKALKLREAFESGNVDVSYKDAQDVIDQIKNVSRGCTAASNPNGVEIPTSSAYLNAKKVSMADYDRLEAAANAAAAAAGEYAANTPGYFAAAGTLVNEYSAQKTYYVNVPTTVCDTPLDSTLNAHGHGGNDSGFVDKQSASWIHADCDELIIVNRRIEDLNAFVKALNDLKIGPTAKITGARLNTRTNGEYYNRAPVASVEFTAVRNKADQDSNNDLNVNAGKGDKFYVYSYTVQELGSNEVSRVFESTQKGTSDSSWLSEEYPGYSALILNGVTQDFRVYPVGPDGKVRTGEFKGGETIHVTVWQATRGDTRTGASGGKSITNYSFEYSHDFTFTLEQDLYTGPVITSAVYDEQNSKFDVKFNQSIGSTSEITQPYTTIKIQVNNVMTGDDYDARFVLSHNVIPTINAGAWTAFNCGVAIPSGDVSIAIVSDERERTAPTTEPDYYLRGAYVVKGVPSITEWGSEEFRTNYWAFYDLVKKAEEMLAGDYVAKKDAGMTTAEAKALLAKNLEPAQEFVANAESYGYCQFYKDQITKLQRIFEATMDKLIPGINKADLRAAIEKAENLVETDYTADSWKKLTAAKNQAIAVRDNDNLSADVKEDEKLVKDATVTLNNAIDGLVSLPADLTELKASIEAAKAEAAKYADADLSGYSEESAQAVKDALADLQAAIEAGEALTEKSLRSDVAKAKDAVDKAVEALKAAVEALEKGPAVEIPEAPAGGEGWAKSESGKFYYFEKGEAQKNVWVMSARGLWYYLDADGVMATGVTYVPAAPSIGTNKNEKAGWYYFAPSTVKGGGGWLEGGWKNVAGYGDVWAVKEHKGSFGMITWAQFDGNGNPLKGPLTVPAA